MGRLLKGGGRTSKLASLIFDPLTPPADYASARAAIGSLPRNFLRAGGGLFQLCAIQRLDESPLNKEISEGTPSEPMLIDGHAVCAYPPGVKFQSMLSPAEDKRVKNKTFLRVS